MGTDDGERVISHSPSPCVPSSRSVRLLGCGGIPDALDVPLDDLLVICCRASVWLVLAAPPPERLIGKVCVNLPDNRRGRFHGRYGACAGRGDRRPAGHRYVCDGVMSAGHRGVYGAATVPGAAARGWWPVGRMRPGPPGLRCPNRPIAEVPRSAGVPDHSPRQ